MTVYFPRHLRLGRRKHMRRVIALRSARGGGEPIAAVFSDLPGRRWQGRNLYLVVATPEEEVGAAFPVVRSIYREEDGPDRV